MIKFFKDFNQSISVAAIRIPELDGLRGLAILQVLIWHYVVCQIQKGPVFDQINSTPWLLTIYQCLWLTWSGVDLFFVLSGFLLGGILLNNKHATNFFQTFYIRRFCRILPLYILWILLLQVITWAIVHFPSINPHLKSFINDPKSIGLAYYLTFTQNFAMANINEWGSPWLGITWSLAVEEQFYLVLPLLIYACSVRSLPYVVVFLIFSAPVLRMLLFSNVPHGEFWGFLMMPSRMDALMIGVLCALLLRKKTIKNLIHRCIPLLYITTAIIFACVFAIMCKDKNVLSKNMVWYGYSLLAFGYACVLLIALCEKRGVITAVVRNPWIVRLGIIAYGMYLFHQGISGVMHALFLNQSSPQILQWTDAFTTIGAFLMTIVCAQLSWMYFEKPIVDFGRRWSYKNSIEQIQLRTHPILSTLASYSFVFIIPCVVALLSFLLRSAAGPFWQYADPCYVYLFNGIHILKGISITHIDHPGTPLQLLYACVISVLNLGRPITDTVHNVLLNPEYYLHAIHIVLVLGVFLTSSALAAYIFYKTRNKIAAILSQIPGLFLLTIKSLDSNLATLPISANISCEPLLISIINLLGIAICILFYARTPKAELIGTLLLGLVAGLGIATKLNFLAIFIFIFLMVPWKKKLLFIGMTIMSFFVWTIPIYAQYPLLWKWTIGIFSGNLLFGGPRVLDAPHFLSIFFNKILWTYCVILLITGGILLWSSIKLFRNYRHRSAQFLWALNACVLFVFLITISHYSPHYLIPGICLLSIILPIFYLEQLTKKKIFIRLTIVLILVFGLQTIIHTMLFRTQLSGLTNHILTFNKKLYAQYPGATIMTTADRNIFFDQNSALLFANSYFSFLLSPTYSFKESSELFSLYPQSFYFNLYSERPFGYGVNSFTQKIFADDLLNHFPHVILINPKINNQYAIDFSDQPLSVELIKTSDFADAFLLTNSTEKQAETLFAASMTALEKGQYREAFVLALKSKELKLQPKGKVDYFLSVIYNRLQNQR